MVKARRVPGIRPKKSLLDNARLVVDVRLDELLTWRCALEEGAASEDLHAMRIAAKRLRYALEMFDVCFPEVKAPLKQLTDIQEDLGTIHDLDVLADLLRARLHRTDAALEQGAVEIMSSDLDAAGKSNRLRKLLYGAAREQRRLGLYGLIGSKTAERARRFQGFQKRWSGGDLDALAHDIREVTGLIPPEAELALDGGSTPSQEPSLATVSTGGGP